MDQKTIDTYNQYAKELAAKFDEVGVRISDIAETFALIEKKNPKVFEIGCGNGRDAEEILKRTNDYLGIDASEKMIFLAREKNPGGNFAVADITSCSLPSNLDIVFAFASLLHVSKGDFTIILERIEKALNDNGAVRLSLKYRDQYGEIVKNDEFGTRLFYYYSQKDIVELAKEFRIVKNDLYQLKGTTWLEVLLQKVK